MAANGHKAVSIPLGERAPLSFNQVTQRSGIDWHSAVADVSATYTSSASALTGDIILDFKTRPPGDAHAWRQSLMRRSKKHPLPWSRCRKLARKYFPSVRQVHPHPTAFVAS